MLESFGPEHAAMPRLSLHSALGTALLLISPLAMALGFGPTRNQTTLGQPLNFAASVMLDADETVPRDCVTAEVIAGDNPVATRHVRAVLEATRDPGQRIVRVTTSIAIDEPVVTIEVSIGCGSRISRRFVAFIDPPSLHLAEAMAPSETVPLPSSRIESQVATLADVARQADASRRRGGSTARADDGERPPLRPGAHRRTAPPAAVTVASATPVQGAQAAQADGEPPTQRSEDANRPGGGAAHRRRPPAARSAADPGRPETAAGAGHVGNADRDCSRRRQHSR